MKPSLNPHRNQALTVVQLLVMLIVLMVFIGSVAYVLIKAIERLRPKPLPEEDSIAVKLAVDAAVAELQARHPGDTVTLASVQTSYIYVPVFVPFEAVVDPVIVERSTNLLDWSIVAELLPNDVYRDTNNAPQAFYRTWFSNGEPVPATNTAARFEWIKLTTEQQ